MRKHCGNCANYRIVTNQFYDECEKCVAAILPSGEQTDPSHWKAMPQTNADRIRAMSDAELCDLFREIYNAGCDDATAWEWGTRQNTFIWDEEWLKQPAKENNDERN